MTNPTDISVRYYQPNVHISTQLLLIGGDGDARVRAEDWAGMLDTIGYEIVCGISARVPRRHLPATP